MALRLTSLLLALAVLFGARQGIANAAQGRRGVLAVTSAPIVMTMPAKATGTVEKDRARWYAKITIERGTRERFPLPTCDTKETAEERKNLLVILLGQLRKGNVAPDLATQILRLAGERDGKALAAVLRTAESLCAGRLKAKWKAPLPGDTFESIGKRWTSGELAEDYPDHVKAKKTAERDRQRLERYIYPIVRDIPIAEFKLEHAEDVMRALPRDRVRAPATRRHVAQLLHRVLALAVFPLKLAASNPLPAGFMPKVGKGKAKGWLYPSEDRALLSRGASSTGS